MLVQWNDRLSVNIKEIDEQHRHWIGTLNMLHAAMAAGKGNQVLADLFERLEEYSVTHFHTEEGYMSQFRYPDQAAHHQAHLAFIAKLDEFRAQLPEKKPTLSIEISNFLKEWFLNHIQVIDMKYSRFFNEHGLL